jgi:cell division protein FtsL
MKHLVALPLLCLAVLAGGLATVHHEYRGRVLMGELQALQRNANELELEWQQLLLEQSTLSAKALIDQVARTRLGMTVPEPTEVIYVER